MRAERNVLRLLADTRQDAPPVADAPLPPPAGEPK
jgi:hypothetical protein